MLIQWLYLCKIENQKYEISCPVLVEENMNELYLGHKLKTWLVNVMDIHPWM